MFKCHAILNAINNSVTRKYAAFGVYMCVPKNQATKTYMCVPKNQPTKTYMCVPKNQATKT